MFRLYPSAAPVTLACAALACAAVQAQTYPQRPIQVVVGIQAGSSTDGVARMLTKRLTERLGQPVLVDNRPGAGGTLGAEAVVHAEPDGYTLLWGSSSLPIYPFMYPLRFDPTRDLVPVGMGASGPLVLLTRADSPFKSVADIVARAKSSPGSITYASAGVGSNSHLCGEVFAQIAGVRFVHVPYKGSSAALLDLMSGQIDFVFDGPVSAIPNIKANRVRALAVTTAQRSALLPETPSMDEAGVKGFAHPTWLAFFAPKGTPKAVIDRLSSEIGNIEAQPEFVSELAAAGMEPYVLGPEALGTLMQTETVAWGRKIKAMKLDVPQ